MKKLLYILLVFLFCFSTETFSQNPQWIVYDTTNIGLSSDMIYCLTLDNEGNKWMGVHDYTGLGFNTQGLGLVKFDDTIFEVYDTLNSEIPTNTVRCVSIDQSDNLWLGTGWAWTGWEFIVERGVVNFDGSIWTVYDTTNSDLPNDDISCIAIDYLGNKWVGTGTNEWGRWPGQGLTKFNGPNWTVYDTLNSGIPSNSISCITIDDLGNKWIGTYNKGIAKFDDVNWSVFDTLNSGLPSNSISSIAIDEFGNIWIGTGPARPAWPTGDGLAKFDGTNWIVYDTSNSELPSNHISCIVIDDYDNKWIGTYGGGLAKLDSTSWSIYNTSNSGLSDNWINCIIIDKSDNNKWIGTFNGLAVFNESGIVSVDNNETNNNFIPNDYILSQNYPNPFNPSTTIKYSIPISVISNEQSDERNLGDFSSSSTPRNYNTFIQLKIYDILGREVALLVEERQKPGHYEIDWDAGNLGSGVYFYRLQAGDFVDTRKMVLLK